MNGGCNARDGLLSQANNELTFRLFRTVIIHQYLLLATRRHRPMQVMPAPISPPLHIRPRLTRRSAHERPLPAVLGKHGVGLDGKDVVASRVEVVQEIVDHPHAL
eukprot:scaffold22104_cov86-Phaeocystis_antarctica.AAC.4